MKIDVEKLEKVLIAAIKECDFEVKNNDFDRKVFEGEKRGYENILNYVRNYKEN